MQSRLGFHFHSSINFPLDVLRAEIIWPTILAQRVDSPIDIAELKLLASPGNVVINHVDQDSPAEDALLLQQAIDQVKLVADGLLLLLSQLWLLRTFSADASSRASLDLERSEDVLEARQERLLFLLVSSVDHYLLVPVVDVGAITAFIALEEVSHRDVVDLSVGLMDIADSLGYARVLGRVALNVRADTLAVERMQAGVHEELTIVKHSSVADVAVLGRVYRDVPILLMAALRSEKLSILRMLLDLRSELFDLFLVVVKTVAQVLFHVTHLGLLREQVQQIFDFQDIVLPNDSESLLHLELLAV